MSYHNDPVAQSGQRKTRLPRVIIAGFFLHLVHWKVNTVLDLLTSLLPSVIGREEVILKLDLGAHRAVQPAAAGTVGWDRLGDTIGEFEARIQNQGDSDQGLPIHIQIKSERFRIWAGPNRLGSWPLDEVAVERLTPFRFRVVVEGDPMIVVPDDPTGFAAATNAFVDVRTPRFGLADRIRSQRES